MTLGGHVFEIEGMRAAAAASTGAVIDAELPSGSVQQNQPARTVEIKLEGQRIILGVHGQGAEGGAGKRSDGGILSDGELLWCQGWRLIPINDIDSYHDGSIGPVSIDSNRHSEVELLHSFVID